MKLQSDTQLLALVTASGAAPEQASTEERSSAFQAVEGGPEMTSGETLLVQAYGIVWLVVFAFLWVSWRRQARIDTRVGELEKRLAEHQG